MSSLDLRPRSSRLSASAGGLIAGLLLIAAGISLAERPLQHTDLWGHLAYGRYYDQHREFPPTEPFLQHSGSKPYLPTCWLAQWGGYRIRHAGGTVALQLVYALLICGIAGGFLWTARRVSRSWLLVLICCAWFLWLEYQQLLAVRPQHAGIVCYMIAIGILSHRRQLSAALLAGLLLVMLLWTNLHGSFAIAPVILAIAVCGRILDVVWRQRLRGRSLPAALRAAVCERVVRRNLLIALGLVAVSLLNPFGWKLWFEVLTFSSSPNLRDLIEWKPLWQTPKQGTVVLISLAITLVTLAGVRLRPRWESWLPVLILSFMMVRTSRHIIWWAPLLVLTLLPYWNVWRLRGSCATVLHRAFHWLEYRIPGGRVILLVASGLALWMTPWGSAAFRGGPWNPHASYTPRTPIAATQALQELDPPGLVYNTMEWGDWMIWSSHDKLPVFAYTHVPEIPPDVWRDYISFIRQSPGWKERWDSYQFSYALIEYRRHDELAESLEADPVWEEVYRDRRAVIFKRVK